MVPRKVEKEEISRVQVLPWGGGGLEISPGDYTFFIKALAVPVL
jgi:hypothetical protein